VDDLVLVALAPQYAELRSADGTHCLLPVYDPSARRPASTPAARPAPKPVPAKEAPSQDPKPRPMFSAEELTRGLRSLGNGTYVLARALLLKALTNPGGAASGAHFRLAEREGRSLGMEVRGIREGSVLSRMGLRTGDVVKNINGVDVSNPLGLLELLRSVRDTESVTLAVMHDGKERALRYLIE
jgi:general secretion pathway protein C